VGTAALVVGFCVLLLTTASQVGVLGGGDFLLIAAAGLVACVFCTIVALEAHSRRAAIGAILSATPVAMIAYFLLTSDG
jgi:hypothetical protein